MDRYCAHGCRRHTVVWWTLDRDADDPRPDLDWYTCGPCSDLHAEALVAQGWQCVADDREDVSVGG